MRLSRISSSSSWSKGKAAPLEHPPLKSLSLTAVSFKRWTWEWKAKFKKITLSLLVFIGNVFGYVNRWACCYACHVFRPLMHCRWTTVSIISVITLELFISMDRLYHRRIEGYTNSSPVLCGLQAWILFEPILNIRLPVMLLRRYASISPATVCRGCQPRLLWIQPSFLILYALLCLKPTKSRSMAWNHPQRRFCQVQILLPLIYLWPYTWEAKAEEEERVIESRTMSRTDDIKFCLKWEGILKATYLKQQVATNSCLLQWSPSSSIVSWFWSLSRWLPLLLFRRVIFWPSKVRADISLYIWARCGSSGGMSLYIYSAVKQEHCACVKGHPNWGPFRLPY